MATRFFSLSRIVSTNKSLTSLLTRSYTVFSPSLSLSQLSPVRLRSLAAVSHLLHGVPPVTASGFRVFSTRQTQSSMNDSNPNWSNRPPKETILLDGCDFEHWLVVVEKPDENATRDDIIASYIETLAKVVGSAEEARMKIYSVSTKHYFAFGALVSEELSYKLKELPNVRWVLPDSYLDVRNKDYGGEPFINGQAVPYDPKYHDEWVRNNAKAMERNRRNDRPRNFDRSRNFERRRQNVQDQGPPMPNSNQPPQSGQMPPNNMGGMPPNNMGGMPPNNMGGMPLNNRGGMAPNNMGGGMPNNYTGGMRPNSLGGAPNQGWQGQQGNAPNLQGGGPPPNFNYGGPNNNFRPPPSQGYPPNPQVGNQVQGQPPQGYPSQAQGPPPQGYPGQGQGYPSQGVNYGFNNGGPSRGNQYSGEDMPPMPPSPPRNY